MKRPVWLFSMDSEQFNAPPTTTAALTSYFKRYGSSWSKTELTLKHFAHAADIEQWLQHWKKYDLPVAQAALEFGLQPVVGFSFYTWNAAEFLALSGELKKLLPQLLTIAGGPHVQQAEDYLGVDPLDVIFLGEAEVSLQQFLDCPNREGWAEIA
ncbi:MAG: cobalamin-dependent protein, partial [Proteobacteria bacterium]|nr:cobalamin-dependent protein [Pseudomonadota bacterium]